ncbi:relaxase/mobilization nuclease domain-containing protein [uncultured Maribacter sp.]|uniref:relaxase/mobilization nuclease domain-containing protein n=1 Tax=uncultured Maribacter sp. TaxID=431308 RepID=UPI0030DB25EA|tara:strand:+ start:5548 stop:6405 length:858 start_codon:yes stop_codon:yes gene_type:complete
MIGKGKAISHTSASIAYGWNQEKNAEIVFKQHLVGENPNEITKEFELVQAQNYHCKNNTFSFVISPTIEDGRKLKNKDLNTICKKFMDELNLKERQAIAFVHRDKCHVHIHLYVNRIDFKGVAFKDRLIGVRSQRAAEAVAEKMQLKTVRQVQFEKEFNLKELRQEVQRRHNLTLKQFKPKSFEQYIDAMARNGIKVIPSINKANKLQGFRFEYNGQNLKGSEIHRTMTGSNIGKELAQNTGVEKFIKQSRNLNLMGKTVEMSTNMLLSIAKTTIKKTITQGIGY